MKLNDYLDKHKNLNALETSFVKNIFYKDYGEKGLDLLHPQIKIDREDGSGRNFVIDFVLETNFRIYAIETHGLQSHDQSGKFVNKERFDDLIIKNNLLREKYDIYIELTREQIMTKPHEAIWELRKHFKADKFLTELYLNRGEKEILPNPIQSEALISLNETRANGNTSGLVVLATGLGKTFLSGFDMLQTKSKKILFIAHVAEILKKTKNDFEDLMPSRIDEMGIFMSGIKNNHKDIIFSTIQSLSKKKNLELFPKNYFDYIVIDEAHHSAASTYQKVLNYFNPKFLLGLTATPFRSDDKDILSSFSNNLIYKFEQEEAVKQGYLSNIEYKGYIDNIDYSNIRWNGSKYDIDDLNKNLMVEKRDKAILSKFNKEASNKKTIGFCVSIDHAEYMSNLFNKSGIKSVAIHSKAENSKSNFTVSDKEDLISKFRNDVYQVAFTVNMFNEGVDIPDIENILMLRPTDSLTILIQQIGRGLRISEGKDALQVLDFIGNYRNAPLILDSFGLDIKDFKHQKDIYYYDNNGLQVEFQEEVIEIFKAINSKLSKDIDFNQISQYWLDYSKFLSESTKSDKTGKESLNHYWQVDKKKRDLKAHFWMIDYVIKNKEVYKSRTEMEKNLKNEISKLNYSLEGLRALFFSKLLGFITDDKFPFKLTEAYKLLKSDEKKDLEIINNQMEKLFFWNDIYSKVNRHFSGKDHFQKEDIFKIYTIQFLYQVITRLFELDEETYISKFEFEYFICFARNHEDLDMTVENIIKYRNNNNVYELEKFLKQSTKRDTQNKKYQNFDTRYFSILQYLECFHFSKTKIVLKEEYTQQIIDKVDKFEDLLNKDIFPSKNDYKKYRKLLYSSKSIYEYFDL